MRLAVTLFTFLFASVSSEDLVWQTFGPRIRESSGCNFPGNDFQQWYNISLEDCRSKCQFHRFDSNKCTHYVWNPDNAGKVTCFFKFGEASEKTANLGYNPAVKCGFLTQLANFSQLEPVWEEFWPSVRESTGCDFPRNDILQTTSTSLEDCRSKCQFQKLDSFQCTHYVWNPNIEGGTCYLKSGVVSEKTTKPAKDPAVKCGFLTISWIYSSTDDVWWSFNCKYTGNDLQTIESRGEDCGTHCQNNKNCTHFNVHKNHQGVITCVMKSGGASKSDAELDLNLEMGSVCGVRNQPETTTTSQTRARPTIPSTTPISNTIDEDCDCMC